MESSVRVSSMHEAKSHKSNNAKREEKDGKITDFVHLYCSRNIF